MSSLKDKSEEGFEELFRLTKKYGTEAERKNIPSYSKVIRAIQAQSESDISDSKERLHKKFEEITKSYRKLSLEISQDCVGFEEGIRRKHIWETRLRLEKMKMAAIERDKKLDEKRVNFEEARDYRDMVLENEIQRIKKSSDEDIQKLIVEAQTRGIIVDEKGMVTKTVTAEKETETSTEMEHLPMDDLDNLFEEPSTQGLDKIRRLQKILEDELIVDFSNSGEPFNLPKNNELKMVKLNELSRTLNHISGELVGVEKYVTQVRDNIDMAEDARKEWKKRIKKAQKAYEKAQDAHSTEIIMFLKKEAERMVQFIDALMEKENKKVSEAMKTLRTFHLVDYKIKSSIFEETKDFMFNSALNPAENARLEHTQFSNSLNVILERLEPSDKKQIES